MFMLAHEDQREMSVGALMSGLLIEDTPRKQSMASSTFNRDCL